MLENIIDRSRNMVDTSSGKNWEKKEEFQLGDQTSYKLRDTLLFLISEESDSENTIRIVY